MEICCWGRKGGMKKRSRNYSAPGIWIPLSLIINADTGFAYYLAGRYEPALQAYQKVVAANPNFLPVHFYLAKYYRQTGQFDLWLKESVEDDRLAGLSGRANLCNSNLLGAGSGLQWKRSLGPRVQALWRTTNPPEWILAARRMLMPLLVETWRR